MKINTFLFYICIAGFAISCQPKIPAETIIENSLEKAHGGKENWEIPKTLIYQKTTILYDSLGNVESQKKQVFHNTLQPVFTSQVDWEDNGIKKRIVFDGKETQLFFDQEKQTNGTAIEKAHKEIIGAQYVLWQPYKLLADDAILESEGIVRLEDGYEAYAVKVLYPNSDTQWWYYFDTETWILKENLVKHGVTFSHIINIEYEEKTGLRLHKERKSFMVDPEKYQKYLRAHYYYDILKLE